MAVFCTLRVSAKPVTEVHFVGIVEISKEPCPFLIVVKDVKEGRFAQVGEVVSGGVALLVTVVEAIVQLEENALCSERAHAVSIAEGAASLLSRVLGLRLGLKGIERLCVCSANGLAEVVVA